MKLQKKNLLKYLKQDAIITGPNVNIGDMSDIGDTPSTTPTETNKVDDFSAADIPLVMKTTPIYGNDKYLWSPINKKKKRTDFYKSFELNEAKQEKIDHIFDSSIKKLLSGINYFPKFSDKKDSLIFTFKRFTNLEITLDVDKKQDNENNTVYKKIKLCLNVMPFSLFKYQPIEQKTIEWKLKTGDRKELKTSLINAYSIICKIYDNIAEISKHLNAVKSIETTFKKYIDTI